MYHSYFGIEEQAFSIAVNPRYMYMSAQHREALAHLLYGVKSGGFVMLTGEVGTGKTTTIRCLLEQLPGNADVAMVMNPAASARDLMCSICDEFGVSYHADETSLKILTDKLNAFLLDNHSQGRNSIVLIDEAQLLRISTLEQIRLLTNLESNTQKMLQIILVGQPELNDLLAKPALRQLSQRITARYHLRPLNVDETKAYIRHRLSVAGMPPGRDPFPENVVKKVHSISGGIPRLINILCDRMLLGAYTRESTSVDAQICQQASAEVLGDPREREFKKTAKNPTPWIYAAAAVSIAGLFIFAALYFLKGAEPAPAPELAQPAPTVEVVKPELTKSAWHRSRDKALAGLLSFTHGLENAQIYPCWQASKNGLHCETLEARTWTDFLAINRAAVLTLNTPTRHEAFVTVVAIEDNTASAWVDGELIDVSLDELGTLWTGEYVIAWQRPELFETAIGLGSSGPLVDWLAERFSRLDSQQKPLAKGAFNKALEERVKLFQRSYGLADDGLAGLQTLLRLGEALGESRGLQDVKPANDLRQAMEN